MSKCLSSASVHPEFAQGSACFVLAFIHKPLLFYVSTSKGYNRTQQATYTKHSMHPMWQDTSEHKLQSMQEFCWSQTPLITGTKPMLLLQNICTAALKAMAGSQSQTFSCVVCTIRHTTTNDKLCVRDCWVQFESIGCWFFSSCNNILILVL